MVNTLAPSLLIGCSLFLEITRTTIKSRMSSTFGQNWPWTVELVAFERMEKSFTYELFKISLWHNGSQVSDQLPFGLLVCILGQ